MKLLFLAILVLIAVVALLVALGGRRPATYGTLASDTLVAAEATAVDALLAAAGVLPAAVHLGEERGAHWLAFDGEGHVTGLQLNPAPALESLEPARHLRHLRSLAVHGAPRLEALAGCPSWKLTVTDSGVVTVAGLEDCETLQVLDLRNNHIATLAGLAPLPQLRVLDLSGNLLTHLEGLAGRTELVELNLGSNRLESLEGLQDLPQLEGLLLDRNHLETLDGLGSLPNLRRLLLQKNRLVDATALDASFPKLEVVNLADNRLQHYPALAARLPPHLVTGNPGTVPEAASSAPPEGATALAAALPAITTKTRFTKGLNTWSGSKPTCWGRIRRLAGTARITLARFELETSDPKRQPVRVRLRLEVEKGRARAYLARQVASSSKTLPREAPPEGAPPLAGGYPYIEVTPGAPRVMTGHLFVDGAGVSLVIESRDGSAEGVHYRVEPER